jgi:hypothetical protein
MELLYADRRVREKSVRLEEELLRLVGELSIFKLSDLKEKITKTKAMKITFIAISSSGGRSTKITFIFL